MLPKLLVKPKDLMFNLVELDDEVCYDDIIMNRLIEILKEEEYNIYLPYEDDDNFIPATSLEDDIKTNDDCPYCNNKNSIKNIMSEGIRVCSNQLCGKIVSYTLDQSPEWKMHQN